MDIKIKFNILLSVHYSEFDDYDDDDDPGPQYKCDISFDENDDYDGIIPTDDDIIIFFKELNYRKKYHPEIYFPSFINIDEDDFFDDKGIYSVEYIGYFHLKDFKAYMYDKIYYQK